MALVQAYVQGDVIVWESELSENGMHTKRKRARKANLIFLNNWEMPWTEQL